MTNRRRRRNSSDWILSLQHTRNAKKLRRSESLPSSTDISDYERTNPTTELRRVTTNSHHTAPSLNVPNHPITPNNSTGTSPQQRNAGTDPALDFSSDADDEDYNPSDDPESNDILDSQVFQPFQPSVTQGVADDLQNTSRQEHITCSDVVQISQPRSGQDEDQYIFRPTETLCQSPDQREMNTREADIDYVQVMRRKWEEHLNLAAVVAIVGSVRYTVEQNEYTRSILHDELPGSGQRWPPYSCAQRCFKEILETCLPESRIVPLPRKSAKLPDSAQYVLDDRELDGPVTAIGGSDRLSQAEDVRIFLPSEWANLDVATSVVFDSMFEPDPCQQRSTRDIERSRLVMDRRRITSACEYLNIDNGSMYLHCSPGSDLKVTVLRELPHILTPFQIYTQGDMYKFQGTSVSTCCVGAKNQTTPSTERALAQEFLSQQQKSIVKVLATAPPRPSDPEHNTQAVLPGDICTLLRAERRTKPDEYDALIVHRFWRFQEGTPSILLFWIRTCEYSSEENHSGRDGPDVGVCDIVSNIQLSRYCATPESTNSTVDTCVGHLADGTPYVVYRILLYCDDFQKSSQHYPKGSAGGCYFLPLSLPPERRRSTSAVRIISLTPPGVSTNEVLYHIVDDLVHASVCGLDGVTPDGVPVKIFIDVVGFIGDYPAAAGTVDVIGHVGRAPCTLCSFRRPMHPKQMGQGTATPQPYMPETPLFSDMPSGI